MIKLDEKCRFVIDTLEQAGFEAFAVGGCIRDAFMGKTATDYDVTTSALPRETKRLFSQFPVVDTGIKHGTLTVFIEKTPFEITTYRKEGGYSDNRRPDNIEFVANIEEDLSRRDFTVNAIAYSEKRGIIDPYSGIQDIKNRVIRAVGNPQKRFSEDSLRIIRALRFASTLGFEIEDNTENAIFELSDTLKNISSERLFEELKKMISGDFAKQTITKYKDALRCVFEINDDISKLDALPNEHSFRFAYICKEASKTLDFLKADNETKRISKLLIESAPIPKDAYLRKKQIVFYGREDYQKITTYRRALFGEDLSFESERTLKEPCLSVSELEINGNDLKKLGLNGREIGSMLKNLLDLVLKGEIQNKKQLLLDRAKDIDI